VSRKAPARALFDTSVLVAGMVSGHPDYPLAQPLLNQVAAGKLTGLMSTHSLAETFAVLTRLAARPMIGSHTAREMIEENLKHFEKVPLLEADYLAVIKRLEGLQFSGGAIYDALIAQVALKAKVTVLYSFNAAHFVRLGADVAKLVIKPS
jgi:predicted nucleic acid-binding protein